MSYHEISGHDHGEDDEGKSADYSDPTLLTDTPSLDQIQRMQQQMYMSKHAHQMQQLQQQQQQQKNAVLPSDEQMISFKDFKYELARQRDIYEDEIMALSEELEYIRQEGSRIIREKCEPFRIENAMLMQKLVEAGLMAPEDAKGQDSEKEMPTSERQALQAYYEHMRRQQQAAQQEGRGRAGSGETFKTPEVIDFEQYWDYGQENMTASANYRPGNSNTFLRRPRVKICSGKPYSSARRKSDGTLSENTENLRNKKLEGDDKKQNNSKTEQSSPGSSQQKSPGAPTPNAQQPLIEFSPINDRKFSDEDVISPPMPVSAGAPVQTQQQEEEELDKKTTGRTNQSTGEQNFATAKSLEKEFNKVAQNPNAKSAVHFESIHDVEGPQQMTMSGKNNERSNQKNYHSQPKLAQSSSKGSMKQSASVSSYRENGKKPIGSKSSMQDFPESESSTNQHKMLFDRNKKMVVKSAQINYKKIKGKSADGPQNIPIKKSNAAAPAPALLVYTDFYDDYENQHKIPVLRNVPEFQDDYYRGQPSFNVTRQAHPGQQKYKISKKNQTMSYASRYDSARIPADNTSPLRRSPNYASVRRNRGSVLQSARQPTKYNDSPLRAGSQQDFTPEKPIFYSHRNKFEDKSPTPQQVSGYKDHLRASVERKSAKKKPELEESARVQINKLKAWSGQDPVDRVQTVWNDSATNPQFNLRSPKVAPWKMRLDECLKAHEMKAKQLDGCARKAWDPEKEQYTEFLVDRDVIRARDTDLAFAGDHSHKRRLMKDRDSASKVYPNDIPEHYKQSYRFTNV